MLNQIKDIEFHISDKDGLSGDLESVFGLSSSNLSKGEKKLLRDDFDFYLKKGRWVVHNTFAGGIIFLREPETIEGISIKFDSELNAAIASVEYASENRIVRNVKYKPEAGKVESTKWNMLGVFPNFHRQPKNIKIILIAIIGKIVKRICEHYKKDSWFMEFEKEFDIHLFLDGKLELKYHVDVYK